MANNTALSSPAELERRAVALVLAGDDPAAEEEWTKAHEGFLSAGELAGAARCAFWLGMHLRSSGEFARAGGWFARATRVLDEADLECVERGYLLIPQAMRAMYEGQDVQEAMALFQQAEGFAERFGDRQLKVMARHGRGRTLVREGDVEAGMAFLDETMVAVTAGEVTTLIAGALYCSMIEACHEVLDLRRAGEWTSALTRWCETQPDAVPHRGICLVHRSQVLQLHGDWPDAVAAAQEACDRLLHARNSSWNTGFAFYQRGELHRLQGNEPGAEEAYQEASRWGCDPQPGLALLRASQGKVEPAVATARRLLADQRSPLARAAVLPACVEVLLTAGDTAAARTAAGELTETATASGNPLVAAMASQATGAVLVAEGNSAAAVGVLRDAVRCWLEVGSPYEAARTRALLGQACRHLGDEETAQMEFGAARRALSALHAAPELARLDALANPKPQPQGGLTGRELEVLRLLATGKRNKDIAEDLVISEKTVARHVSNIFTKLSLSSRAEATAHAHRHHLV